MKPSIQSLINRWHKIGTADLKPMFGNVMTLKK